MDLAWYRADTSFTGHDKVLELVDAYGAKGKAAGFVYLCALGHSVGYKTDGMIRRTSLRAMHGTVGDATILVAVGLWEEVEGGWLIRNFGTRQVVGAEQQAIAEAFAAAGKKGSLVRWGDSPNEL